MPPTNKTMVEKEKTTSLFRGEVGSVEKICF
jgi:hypothetical protein